MDRASGIHCSWSYSSSSQICLKGSKCGTGGMSCCGGGGYMAESHGRGLGCTKEGGGGQPTYTQQTPHTLHGRATLFCTPYTPGALKLALHPSRTTTSSPVSSKGQREGAAHTVKSPHNTLLATQQTIRVRPRYMSPCTSALQGVSH